jgi:hypothetical protein
MVASFAGRPLAAWGGGCRSTAPTLPSPSLTSTTSTTIATPVRGSHAPPLRSVPSRRTPLIVVNVADHGRWRRHEGVWGVAIRGVEEEVPCRCTHSLGSDPTLGGRRGGEERCDISGVTWQKTSGWGMRRRRCSATRAMATTTMASGKGGGRGGGGHRGKKVKKFVERSSS